MDTFPATLLVRKTFQTHTHMHTHTHTHAHTHTHIHTHMQTHTHAHTHRMVRIMEVIVNQTSSQRDWKHSVRSVLKLGVKHFQVNNKHSGNSQQPTHQQHREFKGAETCVCAKIRLGTPLMTSKKKTVNWKQQNSQISSCYYDTPTVISLTSHYSACYVAHIQVPPKRNKLKNIIFTDSWCNGHVPCHPPC